MIQNPVTTEDFRQIALLHKNNLGHLEFFLSRSSVKYIKFFYEHMSKLDSTILLVDKNEDGRIMGFALSTDEKNSYVKRFFKENINRIPFYFSSYIPTIKAILRKRQSAENIDYNQEILYMAVDPEFRGKGILTGLIAEVENKLAQRSNECYLQVHGHNKKAHDLYLKLGFKDIHQYMIGNIQKIVMRKTLYVLTLLVNLSFLL